MQRAELKCKKLIPEAVIPVKAHPTDAGYDLFSCEDVTVRPNESVKIRTGIAMAIPEGKAGVIFPRSSWFSDSWDGSGVIDSGYRGEVMVMLHNHMWNNRTVKKGMKIAQMLLLNLADAEAVEVEELPEGDRGANGFGSTGL